MGAECGLSPTIRGIGVLCTLSPTIRGFCGAECVLSPTVRGIAIGEYVLSPTIRGIRKPRQHRLKEMGNIGDMGYKVFEARLKGSKREET